MLILQLITG